MASYGGYSKTNYNAQGGDDGGGYMGASQQGSQAGGGGGNQNSYQNDSLRPVTIKQLYSTEEAYQGAELMLDGYALAQITFVGQVGQVNPQATNITYRIDDGTASIEVKKWVDTQNMTDTDPAELHPLGSFVRVGGRLKHLQGRPHIGATFIRNVDDFNEVSYHMLEAAYVHLYFTNAKSGGAEGGDGAGAQAGGGGGDSMFVDSYGDSNGGGGGGGGGGGAAKARGCSANAQRIFAYLQNQAAGNDGMEAHVISKGMGMPVNAVLAGADELLLESLIYPTVDDQTWAILDDY
ncbi:hypothetical protein RB595_006509 [Gaeumannomyces hyphopodioides]